MPVFFCTDSTTGFNFPLHFLMTCLHSLRSWTKCPLDIKKQNTPSQKRQKTGDKLSSEIRSAFYRIEPKISIESLFTIFWSHNGGKQFRAPTARKNIFQDNIQVL